MIVKEILFVQIKYQKGDLYPKFSLVTFAVFPCVDPVPPATTGTKFRGSVSPKIQDISAMTRPEVSTKDARARARARFVLRKVRSKFRAPCLPSPPRDPFPHLVIDTPSI